ncbi:hypothetical protein B0H66DRAFT_567789 [Apodospora peruviana]|uniref:Secreted protein n=1 Tax=Apodospora peruviana TaxID=516989 RepID=A0AAE0HWC2_9PEZI|nr:hypothetical protein B0H66DRAFT_567789 [Apodospora peruviana]
MPSIHPLHRVKLLFLFLACSSSLTTLKSIATTKSSNQSLHHPTWPHRTNRHRHWAARLSFCTSDSYLVTCAFYEEFWF